MKKDNKEEQEIRTIQIDWAFLILGAFIAVFAGIGCNALYDILLDLGCTKWGIFIFCAAMVLVLIHIFGTLFSHLKEERRVSDDNDSTFRTFLRYVKYVRMDWFKK